MKPGRRKYWLGAAAVVALLAGLRTAGDAHFWAGWLGFAPTAAQAVVAGGDGGVLPRSVAAEQGLDPEALASAARTVTSMDPAATLLVARRGHLVLEHPSREAAARPASSALLSRLALLAGGAAQGQADEAGLARLAAWSRAALGTGDARNPWSARARALYGPAPELPGGSAREVPRQLATLWQALGAQSAAYATDANGVPRVHCCLRLRPVDGLALAAALQAGGTLQGVGLLTPQGAWAVIGALDDGAVPRGAEPFGARGVRMLRDDAGTRLYFVPARELVILLQGTREARLHDETAFVHEILRGFDAVATPAGPAEDMIVPHH